MLLLLLCLFTTALAQHATAPFTPFKLECPRNEGITQMKLQQVKSFRGDNTDLVFTIFCREMDELFPKEAAEGDVNVEVEQCRWTEPRLLRLEAPFGQVCIFDEYVAGLSRTSTEQNLVSFLCCENSARRQKECQVIEFPTPNNAEETDVSAQDSSLMLASLEVNEETHKMNAKFCKFLHRNGTLVSGDGNPLSLESIRRTINSANSVTAEGERSQRSSDMTLPEAIKQSILNDEQSKLILNDELSSQSLILTDDEVTINQVPPDSLTPLNQFVPPTEVVAINEVPPATEFPSGVREAPKPASIWQPLADGRVVNYILPPPLRDMNPYDKHAIYGAYPIAVPSFVPISFPSSAFNSPTNSQRFTVPSINVFYDKGPYPQAQTEEEKQRTMLFLHENSVLPQVQAVHDSNTQEVHKLLVPLIEEVNTTEAELNTTESTTAAAETTTVAAETTTTTAASTTIPPSTSEAEKEPLGALQGWLQEQQDDSLLVALTNLVKEERQRLAALKAEMEPVEHVEIVEQKDPSKEETIKESVIVPATVVTVMEETVETNETLQEIVEAILERNDTTSEFNETTELGFHEGEELEFNETSTEQNETLTAEIRLQDVAPGADVNVGEKTTPLFKQKEQKKYAARPDLSLPCSVETSLIDATSGWNIACGKGADIWSPARCPSGYSCRSVIGTPYLVCCEENRL